MDGVTVDAKAQGRKGASYSLRDFAPLRPRVNLFEKRHRPRRTTACDAYRGETAADALLLLPFGLVIIIDIQGVDEIAEKRESLVVGSISLRLIGLGRADQRA